VRDSQSMIECFTALIEHFGDQVDGNAFASIHDELARRRQAIADDDVGLQDKLKAFLSKMREARQRVDQWQIDDNGFSAVSGGLMKTYGRGRKALRKAYATPTTENFHEWRKRAKYHWYHARLLQSIWTDMMDVQCDAADRLSDVLGEDHDLGVFRDTLLHDPDRFGSQLDLQAILGLIDRRRAELQAQAQPLGERLLAEKPKKLAARFGAYFRTWQATKKFNPKLDHDLTRTVA
jgi:CHAD domain-containing protein